jgi:hypothetical protein
MTMVGTIITNLSDGLRDNLIGIVLNQVFVRKGRMSNQDIWRIIILLPDGRLFEQVFTEHLLMMYNILNLKENHALSSLEM